MFQRVSDTHSYAHHTNVNTQENMHQESDRLAL